MTQVLSLLRREGPIQVSDRRVSRLYPDGGVVPEDDVHNKAIIWFDRMLVGYTGLASIDGDTPAHATDWWIANALQPYTSVEDGVLGLRDACTGAFSRPRQRGRQLAVVLVGWSSYDLAPRLRPELCIVSNYLGEAVETWVNRDCLGVQQRIESVRADFNVAAFGMHPAVRRLLHVVGQPLREPELRTTLRQVRRAAERSNDPLAEIRLLAERIRLTAGRATSVGKSLMASHLPVPRENRESYMALIGDPHPDFPSSLYLPENPDEPIEYASTLVAGMVMGGGQIVHGGPPPHGESHVLTRFPPGSLPI